MDSTILIFTDKVPEPGEGRRMRGGIEDLVRQTADRALEVSADALKGAVLQAYRNCLDVIEALPAQSESSTLETVTFNLAINGEGQVGLLSTTAKVATQVGLTFQVRVNRPPQQDG